jgi:hypothetical protein
VCKDAGDLHRGVHAYGPVAAAKGTLVLVGGAYIPLAAPAAEVFLRAAGGGATLRSPPKLNVRLGDGSSVLGGDLDPEDADIREGSKTRGGHKAKSDAQRSGRVGPSSTGGGCPVIE